MHFCFTGTQHQQNALDTHKHIALGRQHVVQTFVKGARIESPKTNDCF